MKIYRIFPRRTNATPIDENVIINRFPNLFDKPDKVYISVSFTWDIPLSEKLYKAWSFVTHTEIGGPAFNQIGNEFTPGLFLKKGYLITSRGCNNNCWFCSVPKREGHLKELQIKDGFNIMDDNFLQCSDSHKNKVFEMLKKQNEKPLFTGGLEAKLLTLDLAFKFKEINPKTLYFAYDTPDDYEYLINAGNHLINAGFTKQSHILKAYVLIGFKNDTLDKAEKRMIQTLQAGFIPFAMLYRDNTGNFNKEWKTFQRVWANPKIVGLKARQYFLNKRIITI
jgi:hypothetical protein